MVFPYIFSHSSHESIGFGQDTIPNYMTRVDSHRQANYNTKD